MNTDHNLLFGVLALQADLLTAGQFAEVCSAWAGRKATPLADLLVERGWLTPGDRADVEKLLQRKLTKHGGDVKAGLAEVTNDYVRQSLTGLDDPEIGRTLAGPTPPPQGHVLLATSDYVPENRERYTLTRLHATGGIGRVWLARDASLGRDVALKELRPERSGHPEVWNRFLKEAQITGQLEHPGIVPVYEVGRRPDDNAPFYTMRFVRGRTLAEAARSYHDRRSRQEAGPLELRELVTAFVGVCYAIAYAHSRGVLHRDLKPQNVVLGDYGEVIVLDWGLAKLVGETESESLPVSLDSEHDAGGTVAGQILGTPAYMAPEQAEGRLDRIDARTDVYGLGAILYELLSGQPPFTGKETTDVLRRVIHDMPRPPRETVPSVSRALEAVCLKSLAKHPTERYPSTKELAVEVQHWLADEPVTAHREPWAARTGRWMRRHRTLVTSGVAGLAVAVLVLAGAAILLNQARTSEQQAKTLAQQRQEDAQRERDRAEKNFQLARDAVDRYLTNVAESPRLKDAGLNRLRKELLDDAGQFYRQFLAESADDPGVRTETARAHMRLGFVTEAIGSKAEALQSYQQALDIRRRLDDETPENSSYQNQLAESLLSFGNTQRDGGKITEAEQSIREAVAIRTRLATGQPPDADIHADLAQTYSQLGLLYYNNSRLADAIIAYEDAIVRQRLRLAARPRDTDAVYRLSFSLRSQGMAYRRHQQKAKAEAACLESLTLATSLVESAPGSLRFLSHLTAVQTSLSIIDADRGQVERSVGWTEKALATSEKLVNVQPDVLSFQLGLASHLFNMGYTNVDLRQYDKAMPYYLRALAVYERLAALDTTSLSYRGRVGGTCGYIGRLERLRGNPAAALPWFARGIDMMEQVLKQDPKHTEVLGYLNDAIQERAVALTLLSRFDEAHKDWDRALELARGAEKSMIPLRRAVTIARAGDPAKAVQDVTTLADSPSATNEVLFQAAQVCAVASTLARHQAVAATNYAEKAVNFLKKSHTAGYFRNPYWAGELRQEKDFEPLRTRSDFRALLADVETQAKAKPDGK